MPGTTWFLSPWWMSATRNFQLPTSPVSLQTSCSIATLRPFSFYCDCALTQGKEQQGSMVMHDVGCNVTERHCWAESMPFANHTRSVSVQAALIVMDERK